MNGSPSLKKSIELWLTRIPRWGFTQADELEALLENVPQSRREKTVLPVAVLQRPEPLEALMAAGFLLDRVKIEENRSLRLAAVHENAPLAVHDVLDGAGIPNITEDELKKCVDLAHKLLDNGLRYAHRAQPEVFNKVTQQGNSMLAQMVAFKSAEEPRKGVPALQVLMECGVPKENLEKWGSQVASKDNSRFLADVAKAWQNTLDIRLAQVADVRPKARF